jgi:orotate phosphoribosyltransferase
MKQYKAEFIEFLVRCGVLIFGDFVTKSGRNTPYFVNTGNYKKGGQLAELGGFYARALMDNIGKGFNNLFGPAYKGIPLAVTASIALSREYDHDVSVTFNRKEIKDHGEGGGLIGHSYDGTEKVVIIEDVVTAGTSVRESMDILSKNNNPEVAALIVSVDRMELGTGELTAVDQINKDFGVPTFTIVNVREVIEHLHNRPVDGKVYIDDDMEEKMKAYLDKYGAIA